MSVHNHLPTRVLLIDDDEDDFIITKSLVAQFEQHPATLEWKATYEEGLAAIESCDHDVYLIDYRLSGRDGLALLRATKEACSPKACILLTGQDQPDVDIAAMREGAADFLVKGQFSVAVLERAIRYAIEHNSVLQALRQTARENSLLATAITKLDTGVLITNPNQDGNPIIFCNPAFERITGYQMDDVVGRNLQFLHGAETDPLAVEEIQEALEGHQPFRGLVYDYRKDGTPFWNGLTINPVFDQNNNLTNFVALTNDVTVRINAQRENQQREKHFRALIENISDAIVLVGDNNTISYVSPSGTRILGYPAEELLHTSIYDLVHEDDREAALNDLQQIIQTPDGVSTHEWRFLHKDGFWLWAEVVTQNLLHEPSVQSIVVTYRDITKRKQDEEQLKTSREQLRALATRLNTVREQERTAIAREVHDELGQALTGLKMDVAWLERRVTQNDIGLLPSKLRAMSSMIDETVHTVQRISSELRPSILDDLGLEAAIEWLAQDFHNRTEIGCDFVCSLENVTISPEQRTVIFRILQEAITNIARHANATQVSIVLEENKQHLLLEVVDNGKGITPEDIASTKSLGLIVMRERAAEVGGTVHMTGTLGYGTIIRVSIPTIVSTPKAGDS